VLALIDIPRDVGYPLLALLVGAETSGVPVPGETALIATSVLAAQGDLSIEVVIPVAAAAAIIGDNIGYVIGSRVGRRLLTRPGRGQARRLALLRRGDALFQRHGAKAVFLGRWIGGLRVWASWLAGMTTMPWLVPALKRPGRDRVGVVLRAAGLLRRSGGGTASGRGGGGGRRRRRRGARGRVPARALAPRAAARSPAGAGRGR
jgi:membrane protein YqaA with SNARE-associated domain